MRQDKSSSLHFALLLVVFLISAIFVALPKLHELFEWKYYDFKIRLFYNKAAGNNIVHLDIDGRAIEQFGTWPWDRKLSAQLILKLSSLNPRVIICDILYSSPGRSEEGDASLFEAIRSSGKVVSATAFSISDSSSNLMNLDLRQSGSSEALYSRAWTGSIPQSFSLFTVYKFGSSNLPLKPIIQNSREVGHIKSTPDNDGVHRSIPIIVRLGDRFVPSLALAGFAAALNVDTKQINVDSEGNLVLKAPSGTFSIPIDPFGRMLVNWKDAWKGFPHHSALELLQSTSSELETKYRDKIVVIGVTGTGSTDLGRSPLSNDYPMSRLHSSALETILNQEYIRSVRFFPMPFLVGLMCSIAAALLSFRISMSRGLVLNLVLVSSFLAAGLAFFYFFSLQVPTIGPGLMVFISGVAGIGLRVFTKEAEARRIRKAMERYLSPEMLQSILRGNKDADLSTKRKELTILFADIVSFSSIAEKVDVEYLESFLDEFFDSMTQAVFDHGGTVDKFLGDGLLAFFGDPVELENHALAAITCAEQMITQTRQLSAKWSQVGIDEFSNGVHIRIGITTGMIVVGNIGSNRRMEYTVLGSAVNLASRLQALAKPDSVLISSRTCALAKDHVTCSGPHHVRVKGFDKEISVYELLDTGIDPHMKIAN